MKLPTIRLKDTLVIDMPALELWDAITNTERINREVGLPTTRFTPIEMGLEARGRFFKIPFRWKERPFEWVKGQVFRVERLFDNTPVRQVAGGTRLEAQGEQTRVTLFAEVTPRDIFGLIFAPAVFYLKTIYQIKQLYRKVEKNYRERAMELLPPSEKPRVQMKKLTQSLDLLRKNSLDYGMIEKLSEHIQTAPDDEVVKMRPYALADRWNLPRPEVLRLFLYATKAGLLDMEWSVLCPNCRVAKVGFSNLNELCQTSHCDTCNIEYDVNFDQYVELRFTVNLQVREAYAEQYCVAGPFMTRHIVTQLRLLPGQKREFALPLEPGHYRLRTRPETERVNVEAVRSSGKITPDHPVEITFKESEVYPTELEVTAEQAAFVVRNETSRELLLMLEQDAWGQQGLTAAEVTALQEFRDLFSSEILTPGLGIEIRNLTFLFSDLKDSTAMYERTGDTPAYALVRDHFGIMAEAIIKQQGAVVKTIGDAVMAIFTRPEKAVAASLQIQHEIARLNASQPDREPLVVKLGLHSGACIAITANNILDYFGSTVNTAARVQGISVGNDLVLTEQVYESPGVAELLEGLHSEQIEVRLKGLSSLFCLRRVWVTPQD